MQKYCVTVKYNDMEFSPISNLYRIYFKRGATFTRTLKNIEETSFKEKIGIISQFIREENIAKLKLGYLLFCKNDNDFLFEEDFIEELSFNFETKEGNCSQDIYEKLVCLENNNEKYSIIPESFEEILSYVEAISSTNENVSNFLKTSLNSLMLRTWDASSNLFYLNLAKLVTLNLVEMEKVITSNNNFVLRTILNKVGGTLEKGKKLSKVINIPKFALDYMKEKDLTSAEEHIRNICTDFDGNDLKIVLDYFDTFDSFYKTSKLSKYELNKLPMKRTKTLEYIYQLMKHGYKINVLLNYCLRQQMYWSYNSKSFEEPFQSIKLLRDYVSLNVENNYMNFEKYPQDLERSHNIAVNNFKQSSNEEKNNNFINAIKSNYYTTPIEVDDFVFLVPENINDLILEGNQLHHCIASYVDNIINNTSHIYFMRFKSSIKESYVTLELNPTTNELVESKENYNKEVSNDEAIKALKKFEKLMKDKLLLKVV